ncbi:Zinc finger protein 354A like protein [Argiope bruennichi]|uniref:Zinc finger protein 354A like protein n=1 Tax=Argiope bruennichi TaxID=94029 RepID=A0A8T0F7P2_ARGBR|nr:Zinc finger protein 354A like protein [Argiope bruennichi]
MSRPNFGPTTTFKSWPTNNQLNSELSNRWILNSRFTLATQEPRFTWDETMRRLQQAMEKPGDKKFRCLECLKEFYTEKRYNNHRANHDRFLCFYQETLASSKTPGSQKTQINEKFVPKIMPIYQQLASNELHQFVQDVGHRIHTKVFIVEVASRTVRMVTLATTEGNRGTEGNVSGSRLEPFRNFNTCTTEGNRGTERNVLPFGCQICLKTFPNTEDLQEHEKTHRWKVCPSSPGCFTKFLSKDKMEQHQQLHRPDGHPKPKPEKYRFRCKICLTNFWRKIDLKKHEKMHRPEKCGKGPSCIKELGPKVQMVHPEQLHSPDGHPKPNPGGNVLGYSPMCLENFNTNMNLEEHDETHEPEICGNFSSCRKELDPKGQMVQHGQLHRPVELPKPNPGRKEEHDETHEPETCGNFSSCRKELDPKGQMVQHGQLHRPVELPKPNPGRKGIGVEIDDDIELIQID